MKNQLLLTTMLFLFLVNPIFSQQKTETLDKTEIGPFKCTYRKITDMDSGVSSYFATFMFLDQKYYRLKQYEHISISDEKTFNSFVKDIEAANLECDNKEVGLSWDNPEYSIYKFEGRKGIYVYEKPHGYYAIIKGKDITELIAWLKGLDYGKEKAKK